MNLVTYAVAAVISLTHFEATAASTQASSAAESKLWAFSEEIALSLPGHADDVSKIVSGSTKATAERLSQGSTLPDKEIGPYLFTRDSAIVMGAGHRVDSVSFNLSGSCVPVASLRSRYPSLIVMDYARGHSEHATYTFGAQVGDAIIAYSFPANKLNCMNRVEITPADITKARLRMK